MRVLVTGHRGYIGSVLTTVLQHAGIDVVGLDADIYSACDFGCVYRPIPDLEMDIRDIDTIDLVHFDAVIHLAALGDDYAGDADGSCDAEADAAAVARIDYDTTVHLAACCKGAGVSRFLFASTCGVYGRCGSKVVDETNPTVPTTHHAESKLSAERFLASLAGPAFSPVHLRMPIVYGVSPRLRLDTVVNDLVGQAVAHDRVATRTDGRESHPLMHVEDVARVCEAILQAPVHRVHKEVFNLAIEGECYRGVDVADAVAELLPHGTRSVPGDAISSQSHCADGSKLRRTFPDLRLNWTLEHGIRQLATAMRSSGLTPAEWRCDRYRRFLHLQGLVEHGHIDASLRRPTRVCA